MPQKSDRERSSQQNFCLCYQNDKWKKPFFPAANNPCSSWKRVLSTKSSSVQVITMEIRLNPCKNLCRIFPCRTPFPIPFSGYLNLPGTSLFDSRDTTAEVSTETTTSLGDILPKRYTTLSDDTTANTQEKNMITAATVVPRTIPYTSRFQGDLVSDKILTEICHYRNDCNKRNTRPHTETISGIRHRLKITALLPLSFTEYTNARDIRYHQGIPDDETIWYIRLLPQNRSGLSPDGNCQISSSSSPIIPYLIRIRSSFSISRFA